MPVHDKHRFVSIDEGRDPKSHGLHFHRKDRNKSVPFKPASKGLQDSGNTTERDIPGSRGRQDLFAPSYSGNKLPRGQSPTPSLRSTNSLGGPKSPNVASSQSLQQQPPSSSDKGKSSFWKGFRKQKHKSKDEDAGSFDDNVPPLIMTKSKEKTLPLRSELVNGNARPKGEGMPKRGSTTGNSAEFSFQPRMGMTSEFGAFPQIDPRKSVAGGGGKGKGAKRGESYDKSKDPRRANDAENNFFMLDTDLTHMDGIVQPMPSKIEEDTNNVLVQLNKTVTNKQLPSAATTAQDAWAAPDSWAVRKEDKDAEAEEYPEEEIPEIVGEDGKKQTLAQV